MAEFTLEKILGSWLWLSPFQVFEQQQLLISPCVLVPQNAKHFLSIHKKIQGHGHRVVSNNRVLEAYVFSLNSGNRGAAKSMEEWQTEALKWNAVTDNNFPIHYCRANAAIGVSISLVLSFISFSFSAQFPLSHCKVAKHVQPCKPFLFFLSPADI